MQSLIWVPEEEFIDQKKWIEKEVGDVGMKSIEDLCKQASKVRENSYSPYSKYKVGVTVLCESGKKYSGCNAEVASYSESDHAEEATITKAVTEGETIKSRKFLKAVAVSHTSDSAPCGRCRQIILEHCDNCLVITADENGKIRRITSVKALLPYSFGPGDLGID